MTSLNPITSDGLHGNSNSFRHGFFTRAGGCSTGIYEGLNVGLGSADVRKNVLENQQRVAANLDVTPECFLTPYQVHSPDVHVVDTGWNSQNRPRVDGLVTKKADMAIAVSTADCGPVLYCDAENQVIGAAHAGWKGATSGVLENTITAMEKLGAKRDNISAVLGPTISAEHYEVGPEFVENLLKLDPGNDQYLAPSANAGHAMFDLPAYILARLVRAGVAAAWTGQCTYKNEKDFYSYRRTTHRNEPDYGRQVSAITISKREK